MVELHEITRLCARAGYIPVATAARRLDAAPGGHLRVAEVGHVPA
jgi:hypothetical protein